MTRFASCVLAVAALIGTPAKVEQSDLARGIQQYQDGEFDASVLTLDIAARRLADDPAQSKDLARALLYLGAAYLGLDQEPIARAKFQKALQADRDLRLSPEEFPNKVIRVFEATRKATGERTALEKQARKSKTKGGLVLLGVGGAAAVGLAVVLGPRLFERERENSPPTAAIQVSPEGAALAYATIMKFTASGSDPEGEPLAYSWNFGDGGAGSGANITHVFEQTGTFAVTLTATDGLGASTNVTASVIVRSIKGTWRVVGSPVWGAAAYRLDRIAVSAMHSEVLDSAGRIIATGDSGGGVSDPRHVEFGYPVSAYRVNAVFKGDADNQIQRIDGCVELVGLGQPCTPIVLARE